MNNKFARYYPSQKKSHKEYYTKMNAREYAEYLAEQYDLKVNFNIVRDMHFLISNLKTGNVKALLDCGYVTSTISEQERKEQEDAIARAKAKPARSLGDLSWLRGVNTMAEADEARRKFEKEQDIVGC